MRDKYWLEADRYAFATTLNGAQWAWEFLRRNPAYREDWLWFRARWDRLEARYGKAPDRDFARWKADPEAYQWVDDASGECAVDQDKLLIECWMGAKWGFYKFPLDPDMDQPLLGEQLHWREFEQPVPEVRGPLSPYLGEAPERIAIGFDLDLPLRNQLEKAKRLLQARQARLRRDGVIAMQTVANRRREWCLMLRLLDGMSAGADMATLASVLQDELDELRPGQDLSSLREEAEALVNGGYRALSCLAD